MNKKNNKFEAFCIILWFYDLHRVETKAQKLLVKLIVVSFFAGFINIFFDNHFVFQIQACLMRLNKLTLGVKHQLEHIY